MIEHHSKKWLEDLFSILTSVKPLWLIGLRTISLGQQREVFTGCSPLIGLCWGKSLSEANIVIRPSAEHFFCCGFATVQTDVRT